MVKQWNAVEILTKPVAEQIARCAAEGRLLRCVFGPRGCRLEAVAEGLSPIMLFWERSLERFAEKRSAAMVEWSRCRRLIRSDPSQLSTVQPG